MNRIKDYQKNQLDIYEEVLAIKELVKETWNGDEVFLEQLVDDAFNEGFKKNSARVFPYVLNKFIDLGKDYDETQDIWNFKNFIEWKSLIDDVNQILRDEYNREDMETYLLEQYSYLKTKNIVPKNYLEIKKNFDNLDYDKDLKPIEESAVNMFKGSYHDSSVSLPESISVVNIVYREKHNGIKPIENLFFSIFEQGKILSQHVNSCSLLQELSESTPSNKNFNNTFLKMVNLYVNHSKSESINEIIKLFHNNDNLSNTVKKKIN